MESTCPLCGEKASHYNTSNNNKRIKEVSCPNCKKLSLEEGVEDILCRAMEKTKEEFSSMSKKATGAQYLYFSVDQSVKTMNNLPRIIATIVSPSY